MRVAGAGATRVLAYTRTISAGVPPDFTFNSTCVALAALAPRQSTT